MRFILIFLSALILNVPTAKAAGWDCYSKCMQGGGKYPAQCNDKCKRENARKGISNDTGARNEANYDRACYKRCLSRGGLAKNCRQTCPSGEVENRAEVAASEEESSIIPENLMGDTGDFLGNMVSCFKECTDTGESYTTCMEICMK